MVAMTVGALHRFPVKSMRGESLDACTIGPAGVVGDRAYALVDDEDGRVASAKNPRKWGALLGFRAAFVDEPVLGAPIPPATVTLPDGTETRTDAADVDAVLSKVLGRNVHLADAPPDAGSFEEVWPDIEGLAPEEFVASTTVDHEPSGEAVSAIPLGMFAPPGTFFDLSTIHLLTTATLRRLSGTAPAATFDVRRYRPNVLVEVDGDEFAENGWVGRTVRLGSAAEVVVALPTMRCVMTTLAQDDLPRDRSTLRAIAAANRLEIAGLGTWACAGVYGNVDAPGEVRVGDPVALV
ncbi:MAG TPA: MOSC N-terminal beta barrel domain-containing protein [Acidimicrobiales bacterium]|nr:MOSC N-terminal beta barrel domain-containing protein [Acidimicrobiales bacterium]